MSRRAVVEVLNRIAFAAELTDQFPEVRPEVYSRAAWSIRSAEGELEELISSRKLLSLPGVGESITSRARRSVSAS